MSGPSRPRLVYMGTCIGAQPLIPRLVNTSSRDDVFLCCSTEFWAAKMLIVRTETVCRFCGRRWLGRRLTGNVLYRRGAPIGWPMRLIRWTLYQVSRAT